MVSVSYGNGIKMKSADEKDIQVNEWVVKYLEKAWTTKPEMTEKARNLMEAMYYVAVDEDPHIERDRLDECAKLADFSARMRFSPTIDLEDAQRAVDIVFPDPEEQNQAME